VRRLTSAPFRMNPANHDHKDATCVILDGAIAMTSRSQTRTSRARAPEQEAKIGIGHGSKFTPERCSGIIAYIRAGNFANVAAKANGLSEQTLSEWRTEGRAEPDGRYGAFALACDEAEAVSETIRVARVEKAGEGGDWKADAWHLERRASERWKLRTEQKVDVESEALTRLAAVLSAAKAKVTDDE
jgi:hypothetical protein